MANKNLAITLLLPNNPDIEFIRKTQEELKKHYHVESVLVITGSESVDLLITEIQTQI